MNIQKDHVGGPAEAPFQVESVGWSQPTMDWHHVLDERQRRLVANCRVYTMYDPAGLPGHNLMCIIERLANFLDTIEENYHDLKRALEGETPTCPDCLEDMVRCHEEREKGRYSVFWLCGCEPDPKIIEEAERRRS